MALKAGLGEHRGERTIGKPLADKFLDRAVQYSEGMQLLAKQPDRAASPEAREEWTRELQQYAEAWLASLSGPWEEWESG